MIDFYFIAIENTIIALKVQLLELFCGRFQQGCVPALQYRALVLDYWKLNIGYWILKR
jgi:hypothetical protein